MSEDQLYKKIKTPTGGYTYIPATIEDDGLKTYKNWEESGIDFDKFIKPFDEVDGEMYDYFSGVVSPQYCTKDLLQIGEAWEEKDGVFFYETFMHINNKYFYVGILPEFKQ
jgi:hypothetical protein